jgi:hypothetical protein
VDYYVRSPAKGVSVPCLQGRALSAIYGMAQDGYSLFLGLVRGVVIRAIIHHYYIIYIFFNIPNYVLNVVFFIIGGNNAKDLHIFVIRDLLIG